MQIKHRKRTKSDNAKYEAHVKWMESGYQTKFVPYKNNAFVENCAVKPIAFYLPQFHSFKENEDWYGRGFTEWTNVTRATPQYTGHYQPHLPIDVGFYNLNTNDTFYRQIEIAKNYGIYGFSFYYYWFSGRKLMEKPIYNYLNDKNLNFPFCLCWACENWSKLWDGGNREVLVESDLKENDFEQFWNDFLPFAMDKRYIRINNKPLLIMYRPNKFDKEILKIFVKIIRKKAIKAGFDGLYIIWAITNDLTTTSKEIDIKEFDFDACLEFPPHGIRDNIDKSKNVKQKRCEKYLRPDFNGVIYDIKNWILNKKYEQPLFENTNIYRGVFPMWDNAARKAQSGCLIFDGMTPELYRQWLGGIIKWTKENRPKNEQYIFINAWNEWAEGAHLEPDYKHGYAYLQKTYEALNEEENTSYIS